MWHRMHTLSGWLRCIECKQYIHTRCMHTAQTNICTMEQGAYPRKYIFRYSLSHYSAKNNNNSMHTPHYRRIQHNIETKQGGATVIHKPYSNPPRWRGVLMYLVFLVTRDTTAAAATKRSTVIEHHQQNNTFYH